MKEISTMVTVTNALSSESRYFNTIQTIEQ